MQLSAPCACCMGAAGSGQRYGPDEVVSGGYLYPLMSCWLRRQVRGVIGVECLAHELRGRTWIGGIADALGRDDHTGGTVKGRAERLEPDATDDDFLIWPSLLNGFDGLYAFRGDERRPDFDDVHIAPDLVEHCKGFDAGGVVKGKLKFLFIHNQNLSLGFYF